MATCTTVTIPGTGDGGNGGDGLLSFITDNPEVALAALGIGVAVYGSRRNG